MSKSAPPNIFVTTLSPHVAEKLRRDLIEQGFEFSQPLHTIFAAKKKGVTCALYKSLKFTVQGKEMRSFIEFYLEPEILKALPFTHPEEVHDKTGRIGVDESGKGDFFGPLCVAAIFAQGAQVQELVKLGVKDSKLLNDTQIKKIAKEIKQHFQHVAISISPLKYNELYAKFGNLNSLLAWGHATVIDKLSKLTGCTNVIIDQFANEAVVLNAVRRKKIAITLNQRHRGEEDIVVAAASILAREAFLAGMARLSQETEIDLPKGASSQTIKAGRLLVAKWGKEMLNNVAKQHFRTTKQIIDE